MKTSEALQIIGGLSKPSKMPGWSYGLPAKECKTGSKLRLVPGSTCYNCYALKGCYVFPVVKEAQYRRLQATKVPQWVQAMAAAVNSKRSDWFRWHDSGDVQDLNHLNKIFKVCELTPSKRHWLPTREAWIRDHAKRFPKNLKVSSAQAGGPAHKSPSALEHINLKEKYASLEPDPSARKQETC